MIATKYRYDMVAIGELWSSLAPGNDLLVTWNDERPLYS